MTSLNYGDSTITDPRDSSTTWPWVINILENVDDKMLAIELTGVPYTAPVVDQDFIAYLVI